MDCNLRQYKDPYLKTKVLNTAQVVILFLGYD